MVVVVYRNAIGQFVNNTGYDLTGVSGSFSIKDKST